MKKALFICLLACLSFSLLHAQVPILYYDFENNSMRTTFENSVEQSINSGSAAVTRNGAAAITGVGGAGTTNGGTATGQAITGSGFQSIVADPGTAATTYYQFIVNTTAFAGISVNFDAQRSGTGPGNIGLLYSTDGTNFTAVSPTTLNVSFTNHNFDLSGISTVENKPNVTIRIYGYQGGNGSFTSGGTFRIDNLAVFATTAVGSTTLLEYSRLGLSVKSGTPYTPSYANFNINGSSISVNVNDTLQISGVLTLTNGNLNTNNKFSLKSTSTYTARIAPVVSGTITGNVTIERYLSVAVGNNRAYRLLAPSVNTTSSIHANWQENASSNSDNPNPGYGTHITGTTIDQTNGLDATATGQSSLYTYDQTSPSQTWNAVTNTATSILDAKTGYLIFIRGSRLASHLTSTASPTNTTLRATGTILTGDQTFVGLQGGDPGNSNIGRFSLITNPYASPINWKIMIANASNSVNFENYYTYWDPNVFGRGGYVTVDNNGQNSVGIPIVGNDSIQSGQAFFVKAKTGANSPTFTIREIDKTDFNSNDVFRIGNPESFRVQLWSESDGVRGIHDGVFIKYNNDYSAAVDGNDAQEMANFDENIAIARDGKMLSIESRPLINTSDNIPLSIARFKAQSYEWQFTPLNFAHPNLQAYLQDKFLNIQTPISLTEATIISFNVTSDAASAAADRFTVMFAPSVALPISMTSLKASQKTTGIQVEWNVLNELNIDKYEVQKSADGINFVYATSVVSTGFNTLKTYSWYDGNPNAENNFYRIRSISKTGAVVYSDIVKITLGKGVMVLSVYPNPIPADVIGLQLSNLEKGKYTIELINQLGQKVYSKMIDHAGGSASQSLQVGSILGKGVYQLQLKGEHSNITQQVVKQ